MIWFEEENVAAATLQTHKRPKLIFPLCTDLYTTRPTAGGKYLANVRTGVSDTVYGKV